MTLRILLNRKIISFPNFVLFLVAIANLFFIRLPLLNVFSYEFSVVNAVVLSFFVGLSIIYFNVKDSNYINKLEILFNEKYFYLSIVLIPLLIATINSALFSLCPLGDGYLFYLIITLPSIFFTISLSLLLLNFTSSNWTYFLLIVVLIIIIVILPIAEIYFYPQVYFFNPVIGYFPGVIYDEYVPISIKLISYRASVLFISLLLIYLLRNGRYKTKLKLLVSLLIFLFAFFGLDNILKLNMTTNNLQSRLNKIAISNDFTINYTNLSNNKYIFLITLKHEYYLNQITQELKVSHITPIHSYIFSNSEQKRELIGAGNADLAKPWLNQIYINEEDLDATLKHELLHVISANFGTTPFKLASKFNPALIEGFATAYENNFDDYPIHVVAKIAMDSGYDISIVNLFSGFNFFNNYSTLSYVFAGSFIRFLSEKYGVNVIKKIYADGDFVKHTGKDLAKLESNYKKYLSVLNVNTNPFVAQLYFAGHTIFRKFCVRTAAKFLREANKLYYEGRYKDAYKKFLQIYSYTNSYPALIGCVQSMFKVSEYNQAKEMITKQINKFTKSQYFFNLQLLLADAYILTNNIDSAKTILNRVILENPSHLYTSLALLKEKILQKGIVFYKNFLNAEKVEKFYTALEEYNNSKEKQLIPILLNYAETSDSIAMKIKKVFFDNFRVVNVETSYYAFLLSKYFLNCMDFSAAKYFAEISLEFKKNNYYKDVLEENSKMISWIAKNFNTVESSIKIIK
ncbi:tol-pal system YbgF family protein [Melioribacteraceae bacterium 4301-Me]|uniref:tetratricopeptide repeat protein n=1 Tax=Pyranulibacter aquaticus TaxID=3163344 RepID=UPI00359496B4